MGIRKPRRPRKAGTNPYSDVPSKAAAQGARRPPKRAR